MSLPESTSRRLKDVTPAQVLPEFRCTRLTTPIRMLALRILNGIAQLAPTLTDN